VEKLLTTKQAADVLGVSTRYLQQHREIPRIPLPGRSGRCSIRFRPSDLERLLDARTINPLPKEKKVA
jgi:hypothetical protein